MNLHGLNVLLAQASNAAAPAATGAAPTPMQDSPQAAFIKSMSLPILLLVVAYVAIIRPQSKKAKEQAALLKTVKPGDRVVTSSGIVGIVVAVKDKDGTISLRSAETKLEVLKSAIVDVKKSDGEAEAS
jgi:preprotein translocase subunit YajC